MYNRNRNELTGHEHPGGTRPPTGGFWRSRSGMVLITFFAVAGLLLAYEHRVHILTGNGTLIVLLALCVGVHFFMHGGHGDGHHHDTKPDEEEK